MQVGNTEQFSNHHLSSDWSLQPETMKPESLVIVDQHATVNLYLSLVHTARHIMGAGFAQSIQEYVLTLFLFVFHVGHMSLDVTAGTVTDMKS